MERKKFINTIIGRDRWEKGRQGDKLRGLLANEKAIFRHGTSNNLAPVRVMRLLFTSSKYVCK